MCKFLFNLMMFLFMNIVALAQSGNNHVNVFQNPALDALVNRPADLLEQDNVTNTTSTESDAEVANVKKVVEKKPASVIHAGNKTVTGSIVTKPGYRVLLYNGTDKALAIKIKTEFNRNYINMRSYFDYSAPNYKIKVGDFDDKKVALKFAKQMQATIPTATVVPDVVTIKNIIVQSN